MARMRGLQEARSCFSPWPAGPPDLEHHAVTLHIYDLYRLVRGLNTFLKGIPGLYRESKFMAASGVFLATAFLNAAIDTSHTICTGSL